ncbi:SPOR domain-containing protein [Ferrovum sp.]|uniref:SPOR domain-containing protein n=1 Tax=Ferrovum sp. TaxID=2609467 RepID=UPI002637B4C5|nr:SPOR domain-containing protein [Ferrovum sp.]
MAEKSNKKPEKTPGSAFFIGSMIGLAGGVLLAAGVALYINHLSSPITSRNTPPHPSATPEKLTGSDLTKRGILTPSQVTEGSEVGAPATPVSSAPTTSTPTPATEGVPPPDVEEKTPTSGLSTPATSIPSPLSDELQHPVTVRYFVQTGAFGQSSEAESQRATLALLGIDSTVVPGQVEGKPLYYRVRIGPFSSVEEVRTLVKSLKDNGVPAQVLRETTTSHSSLIPH